MISEALAIHDVPSIRKFQKCTQQPDLSHIPGNSGWPVLGHTHHFLSDFHGFMNKNYKNHGEVFRFKTILLEAVFLLGPEANSLVFQNENKQFSNFLAWDTSFENLFDNNLLERDFNSHKAHRKILQAAFRRPAIEGHIGIMNPLMKERLAKWKSGCPVKAMDHVKKLFLDLGAEVFLGIKIGSEADKLNRAFTNIVAASVDPLRRKELFFMPYAKGIKGKKTLSTFIFNNIEERRRAESPDIFSQICHLRDEEGRLFSDEEIRDHINFLLFAAHDTTTSTLSAVLYSLATNMQWQEEIRAEIIDLNKEDMEFDDIKAMEKTGWTIKEALRMYPALCVMPRYALRDIEFNGHHIPANTIVAVSSLFTHYMEKYWKNPYQFDPKRFSPENAEDKNNFYQYIPFGGGAHKCLGMHFAETQGKMFLFHLLKKYRVTKDPKMTKYKYNNVPLTFPSDGLPLTFVRI